MAAPKLGQGGTAVAVVPSVLAGDNFTSPTDFLYVGTEGDLEAVFENGSVVLFKGAAVGYHPLRIVRVNTTNTTADDIVAVWEGA